MPDVFISYARSDRKRVALIAEVLEAKGYSIWWDAPIRPGKAWREQARKELHAARCTIVCWSRNAAKSDGVLAETTQSYNQHKLVPVTLQACEPPMPYNRVPSADLTQWRGEPGHEYWVEVLDEVSRLVGTGGKFATPVPPPGEARGEARAASRAAPPAPADVAAPAERAPRQTARGGAGARVGRMALGAAGATVVLTGALWAGPQVVRLVNEPEADVSDVAAPEIAAPEGRAIVFTPISFASVASAPGDPPEVFALAAAPAILKSGPFREGAATAAQRSMLSVTPGLAARPSEIVADAPVATNAKPNVSAKAATTKPAVRGVIEAQSTSARPAPVR
jgi:hypothetical protein